MAGDVTTGRGMFKVTANIQTNPLDFGDVTSLPAGQTSTNQPFNNRYCRLSFSSAATTNMMIPCGSQPERASVFWNGGLGISVYRGHYYTGSLLAQPAANTTVTTLSANGTTGNVWFNTSDTNETGPCFSGSGSGSYLSQTLGAPTCPTGFTQTAITCNVGKGSASYSYFSTYVNNPNSAAGAAQIRHPGTYDYPYYSGTATNSAIWAAYQYLGYGCSAGYYLAIGTRMCRR